MTRKVAATQPRFVEERRQLVKIMKTYDISRLAGLMGISEKLAALNVERYRDFPATLSSLNAKPALFAFRGDVYRPMDIASYSDETISFATHHLRILSGLYGLLRPLDYLYPYRLEMGVKLPTAQGNTLYRFWGNRITRAIAEDLKTGKVQEVINLASEEYSRAVQPEQLDTRYITVEFREEKGDISRIVGIHAKHARGVMVDYVLKHRITKAEGLKQFDREGYGFDADRSDRHRFVFIRST